MLKDHDYQGFPIVQDRTTNLIIGYIGQTEVKYAIGMLTSLIKTWISANGNVERARKERALAQSTRCYFMLDSDVAAPALTPLVEHPPGPSSSNSIDFGRYIDGTPITVHPQVALETVMQVFHKLGPRVILVEQKGKLCGLVTVKDVLKYQFKVENRENPRDDTGEHEMQDWLWDKGNSLASWIQQLAGRIRLPGRRREGGYAPPTRQERYADSDINDGVELDGEYDDGDLARR